MSNLFFYLQAHAWESTCMLWVFVGLFGAFEGPMWSVWQRHTADSLFRQCHALPRLLGAVWAMFEAVCHLVS
jgi:hypothetical protein